MNRSVGILPNGVISRGGSGFIGRCGSWFIDRCGSGFIGGCGSWFVSGCCFVFCFTTVLNIGDVSSVGITNGVCYGLGAAVREKYVILPISSITIPMFILTKMNWGITLFILDGIFEIVNRMGIGIGWRWGIGWSRGVISQCKGS